MYLLELTEAQRQLLQGDSGRARLLDPVTNAEYVLVRADVIARVRQLLEQAEDEAEQEAWANST